MTFKNNYNFKAITKNQKFLELLKKSKKTFSANLLNKNLLNLKAIYFNNKLKTKATRSIKETITLSNGINKQIEGLSNWPYFVYTKRITNTKQIQTSFRSIISDQKKRISFDNQELTGTLLKSLLCADFSPMPFTFEKLKVQFDINFTFAFAAKAKGKSFKKNSPYIGPGLILEQSINRQYTKKQGISNIRNRCIVTGRNTIIGKFRLSRITFRRYAGQGLIPGLVKKSH
jgi:ribosomal protein S14|uniref:ribosomal protein S14 n=1 Tax=Ulva meridionalis TaxID=434723 RepID=UPI002114763D|nr:ribosomal protein S14 [Ulva meridionalis]UTA96496.1 ribosomal protein S14 [Ulva meridionalis]UTA96556.1 ribosomal protein S14 [Ulva meridionalis]UTA96613.1 ribosomal protein S14 [Ulva meridionalis]UTA96665.1 ribosomal protein S14 [Ulva meridionalis]UTA96718.1 ribosomal protein S14 [Ulva meridionalis]